MSFKTAVSRRRFSKLVAASSLSSLIMPSSTAFASASTRVLWTGANFIQECGSKNELNCGSINRIFPNLSPHFEDQKKKAFLYKVLPGKWGAYIGKAKQHKLVWWTLDHQSKDELQTDLAMVLGITSDRAIASQYYPTPNLSFMVYEIQSYLLVIDVEAFEIVQSYPIRILSVGNEDGERKGDELSRDISRKMWRSLSGGKNAKSSAKRVPQELQRLFSTLDFNNLKRANVRVTKVYTTEFAKKWVNKEHPQASGKASVDETARDADFKFLLGNSATSSISEKFGIGIQPHTPNASLNLTVNNFIAANGRDTEAKKVLLNTGKIDLDVRLTAKAIIFEKKPKEGAKDLFLSTCTVLVEIEAARYKRVYNEEGQVEQSATMIGAPVLKQNLLGVSQEMTTGTWSNDWYWALDMHQRLFDWFFSAIAQGKDLSKLMKGQRDRYEAREFLTRVYTKDLVKLEKEAGYLRRALLTRR